MRNLFSILAICLGILGIQAQSIQAQSKGLLSEEEIEQIGVLHNQYLEMVLDSFDVESADRVAEMRRAIHSVEIPGVDASAKDDMIDMVLQGDLSSIPEGVVKDYATQADAALEDSESYDGFIAELSTLREDASSNLQGRDLERVLVYYSVLKHSAYFWSPEAFGGSGVGMGSWGKIKWWRVVGSDAIGALGGFFMGGPKGSIIMGLASSALYVIGVV